MAAQGAFDLSVVIPAYNSADYLASTLDALAVAAARTAWRCQVVVVDDGSTDATAAVAHGWTPPDGSVLSVELVRQANAGRFLARWAGLQSAQADRVLLLDSRVLLDPGALAHIEATQAQDPDVVVWNGHAVTDPAAPLVGHFWEVPTHVFWGHFLGDPRPVSFGVEDFHRYPKGTGVFLAPRTLLVEACLAAWPTGDAALASDDTKVIRGIAAQVPIRLDPGFRALYRPRTNARAFVSHSFGRGTFLVDSFGGTGPVWDVGLVGLLLAPVVVLAVLLWLVLSGAWIAALVAVVAGVLVALAPAGLAALRRCPAKGLRAYAAFLPLFVMPYWCGLVRGFAVHGHQLFHRPSEDRTETPAQ